MLDRFLVWEIDKDSHSGQLIIPKYSKKSMIQSAFNKFLCLVEAPGMPIAYWYKQLLTNNQNYSKVNKISIKGVQFSAVKQQYSNSCIHPLIASESI